MLAQAFGRRADESMPEKHRETRMQYGKLVGSAVVGAVLAYACGANDNTSTGRQPASQGGSSGAGMGGSGASPTGPGGSSAGGNGGSIAIDAGSSGGSGGANVFGDACGVQTFQGEGIPLDIYVMYDQSTSMTCAAGSTTRWNVVTPAFQQFLSSPQVAGIGIGIQYFGLGGECNAALYYTPEVPIAPLPGNLPALTNSLQAHANIGINLTTTNAALIGAIDQAKNFKQQNPSHIVVVLLVTDGQPNTCGTVQDVLTTAQNGFNGNPSIRTFVLGIVAGAGGCPFDSNPPNVADLDAVAAAGGTDRAYVLDPASNTAGEELLNALDAIRGSVQLPCQYQLPAADPGQTTDTNKVNVQYTPAGANATLLYQVADASQCGSQPGAWYYDNPTNPQTIILCDATCTAVTQASGGQVDVVLGCQTITEPPE
jgi:hypothetical protein